MRLRTFGSAASAAVVLIGSTAFGRAGHGSSQGMDTTLERWQHHLEVQARGGTLWWTSNADYDEDGGIDAYLIRYEAIPGDLAARGCLWGERDGQAVGPFWEFFMAWDVERERPMLYQVSPGGISGIGHLRWDEGGKEVAEQTFRAPDGTRSRLKHETTMPDDDTRESRSFDWSDGEWTPRRAYTWVRREGSGPC